MRSHYPAWNITKSLRQTVEEIVESWHRRLVAGATAVQSTHASADL
jgi:flagellar biosynthesis/type III secretory pathway ATPase